MLLPEDSMQKELSKLIKAGGGKTELKTVAGGKLWASMKGNKIMLPMKKVAWLPLPSVTFIKSNGVIHVIDHVVLPRS